MLKEKVHLAVRKYPFEHTTKDLAEAVSSSKSHVATWLSKLEKEGKVEKSGDSRQNPIWRSTDWEKLREQYDGPKKRSEKEVEDAELAWETRTHRRPGKGGSDDSKSSRRDEANFTAEFVKAGKSTIPAVPGPSQPSPSTPGPYTPLPLPAYLLSSPVQALTPSQFRLELLFLLRSLLDYLIQRDKESLVFVEIKPDDILVSDDPFNRVQANPSIFFYSDLSSRTSGETSSQQLTASQSLASVVLFICSRGRASSPMSLCPEELGLDPIVLDLLARVTSTASKRHPVPSLKELRNHPLFWSLDDCAQFFINLARLSKEEAEPLGQILQRTCDRFFPSRPDLCLLIPPTHPMLEPDSPQSPSYWTTLVRICNRLAAQNLLEGPQSLVAVLTALPTFPLAVYTALRELLTITASRLSSARRIGATLSSNFAQASDQLAEARSTASRLEEERRKCEDAFATKGTVSTKGEWEEQKQGEAVWAEGPDPVTLEDAVAAAATAAAAAGAVAAHTASLRLRVSGENSSRVGLGNVVDGPSEARSGVVAGPIDTAEGAMEECKECEKIVASLRGALVETEERVRLLFGCVGLLRTLLQIDSG